MDELLDTLETQTAEGLGACADGTPWPAELVEARNLRIAQLCDLIKSGTLISEAQLARIRAIENGGAAILECILATREGLLESIHIASRQESFAKCVETVLDVSTVPELIAT